MLVKTLPSTVLGIFAVAALGGAALAQAPAKTDGALSREACNSMWTQATQPNSKSDLTEADVKPMVSDFKAVDTSADGKVSLSEWSAACDKGLIKTAANSGNTGAHPPTNRMNEAVPTMKDDKK